MVAVIGRPNVGKSTFLNTIVGRAVSIVDNEAGVTRDRIYADAEWCGVKFSLVDTGGLDVADAKRTTATDDSSRIFKAHIKEQADIAIEMADCIIFLCDGTVGVTSGDIEIAKLLRTAGKPMGKDRSRIVLAVNKLDNEKQRQNTIHDFYKLGLGEPYPISCAQKTGLGDLLDAIVEKLDRGLPKDTVSDKSDDTDDPDKNGMDTSPERIAIIGKPNAGKSSIVNRLLGVKRVMVSEIAGTTRDSIDTPFRYNGREYILTDTAGIRRKRSVEAETVEQFSVTRALASIRNSDVCVLVVDANEGLTEQDVRLAGYINEMGKPSVICINKWDLVEKDSYTMNAFNKNLERDLAFMSYFKAVYISALTGQRAGEIMKAVEVVLAASKTRISTGTLNTLINEFIATTPPPFVGTRRAKFMYSTQVSVSPPTFALFVNERDIVPVSYLRYLENCIRKSIDLTGTPIRLLTRNRSKQGQGG